MTGGGSADGGGDESPAKRARTDLEGENGTASSSIAESRAPDDRGGDEGKSGGRAATDLSSDILHEEPAEGTADTGYGCGEGGAPLAEATHRSGGGLSRDEIRTLLLAEANYSIDDPPPSYVSKRDGYLTWDDYFAAVASLSSQRSKDPTLRKVGMGGGACIVDGENRVVGIGYDGFPRGCSDDCLPWASNATATGGGGEKDRVVGAENDAVEGADLDGCGVAGSEGKERAKFRTLHTRDPFLCHAEVNAVLNKCSADVRGARMYATRFPNNDCAKVIIQSGIQEVIYLDSEHGQVSGTETDGESDGDVRYRASRIMFGMAGVRYRRHVPTRTEVMLDFGLPSEGNEEPPGAKGRTPRSLDDSVDEKAEAARARFRDLLLKEADYDPSKPAVPKRTGYLSWDDYFMAVAFLSAQRSKDPNTQVGACIVDANHCIVGIGYNGFPRGCSDEHLPWSRQADAELHRKYPYVCHAEVNAILNRCSADVRGATLYVALFPCNDCAKVIIQSGIREVVFLNDQYHDTDQCRASRIMFRMAGVRLRRHRPAERIITVRLGKRRSALGRVE